jgi:hypothetical protein
MIVIFVVTGVIAAVIMLIGVKMYPPADGTTLSLNQNVTLENVDIGQQLVNTLTVSDFRDLFSKFGSKAKDVKESVVDHAFAAPHIAADSVVSANKFIDNKIVNPIDAKVQQGEVWIDKKLEQGKNYAEIKKQQMTAWKQDKVETAQAVAALIAIKTMDSAQMVKEGAQEKINAAKEKVSQGYEKVTGAGQAAVAAVEQKRKSLFSAAREKMNQIKLGFLNRQLAQERAKAEMAREELEAREAKAKLIEQKMALLNTGFVGGTQEATA